MAYGYGGYGGYGGYSAYPGAYSAPVMPSYYPGAVPGYGAPGMPGVPAAPLPGVPVGGTVAPGYGQTLYEFQFRGLSLADMDIFSKSDPFLVMYASQGASPSKKKDKKHGSKETGKKTTGWVPIYRSETIKNNLNPVWRPFVLDLYNVCAGRLDFPIMLEVSDFDRNGRHDLIGRATTTLRELQIMRHVTLVKPGSIRRPGTLEVLKCAPASSTTTTPVTAITTTTTVHTDSHGPPPGSSHGPPPGSSHGPPPGSSHGPPPAHAGSYYPPPAGSQYGSSYYPPPGAYGPPPGHGGPPPGAYGPPPGHGGPPPGAYGPPPGHGGPPPGAYGPPPGHGGPPPPGTAVSFH